MNEIKAIRQNNNRRLLEQIERDMVKVRQFYKDYPYCDVCKCRAPKGHAEHIYGGIK